MKKHSQNPKIPADIRIIFALLGGIVLTGALVWFLMISLR
jgi:hypothetical protein